MPDNLSAIVASFMYWTNFNKLKKRARIVCRALKETAGRGASGVGQRTSVSVSTHRSVIRPRRPAKTTASMAPRIPAVISGLQAGSN